MSREISTYRIASRVERGVPVYALDGGMSAEYGVQQALANLSGGVSHTWDVQEAGLGPNPVRASRGFLRSAVATTIAAYDALGDDVPYPVVVLGTGVSSASHLANALGAPYLPTHFLASAATIAETQDALDGASDDGYAAYATLAYDESMPGLAVAWLKLLDLPADYADFLRRHRVERVVLLGTRGASPHFARRPLPASGPIAAGQVLVTWPDAGSQLDETWLRRTIADLPEVPLEAESFEIADWESGLGEEQIAGLGRDLAALGIDTWMLAAGDYLTAYDLATYAHAALLRANDLAPRGIVLDPYLITHPVAELREAALPLLYWQLDAIDVTLDRLERALGTAAGLDSAAQRRLPVVVNATLNVGGPAHATALAAALAARGFGDVTLLDTSADETFDSAADVPCRRALDALAAVGPGLAAWNRAVRRLTVDELAAAIAPVPTASLRPLGSTT